MNEEDPAVLKQVGEKMKKLAPNIRFIKDDNPQDDLIAGEIAVGLLYTSQVTQACIANPDLKVVYPEEGVGFGIMSQFIPSNAPHAKEAHIFLDYMMRPEVAKEAAQAAQRTGRQSASCFFAGSGWNGEGFEELVRLGTAFPLGKMGERRNQAERRFIE